MTTALLVGLALVNAALVVLVAGLLRSHAEILRALHELGAGIDPDRSADVRVGGAASRVGSTGPVPLPPPSGAPGRGAVDLVGETLDGDPVVVGVAGAATDTLLLFLSSSCGTCLSFWDAVRRGTPDVPGGARLVVVAKSAEDESLSTLRRLAPTEVPLVLSTAAWDAYGVPGSPYAVYVAGPAAVVLGEGTAATWPQAAALMTQAAADGRLGSSGRPA